MEHLQLFPSQQPVALMPSPALQASVVKSLLFRVGSLVDTQEWIQSIPPKLLTGRYTEIDTKYPF